MNDLISRQAAIDEITEYGSGNTTYMSVAELKRRIEQLPSAQPDKDMIHLQKEQAYMQGWEEGHKALREEIWENGRDRLDQPTGGD